MSEELHEDESEGAENTVTASWQLRCPQCQSDESLDVNISTWARLVADGTDTSEATDGDHEWNETSAIKCCACGWGGTVAEARIPEAQP